jgi:hypothetical protein
MFVYNRESVHNSERLRLRVPFNVCVCVCIIQNVCM